MRSALYIVHGERIRVEREGNAYVLRRGDGKVNGIYLTPQMATSAVIRLGNQAEEAAEAFVAFFCELASGADSVLQNRAEAAYERACADYYGGGGPQTVRERYEASHAR